MSAMSRAADRQVNWNTVVLRYPGKPDIQDRQLASADVGDAHGATIVPMIIPHNFRVRTDFLDSDTGFRSQPSFRPIFAMPRDERWHALQEPEVRAEVARDLDADTAWNAVNFRGGLGDHVVSDVGDARLQPLVGRSVSDLAAERNTTVLDTIFDLAVDANLDIGFARHTVPVATAEQRALRRRVLRDPRLVLGASDGGAHVRGVINAEYSTASFAELVRDDDVFTVEELVQEFTDVPARLYGLTDRGRIEPGAHADLVVFDPEHDRHLAGVAAARPPGRCDAAVQLRAVGIDAVLVGGAVVARDGEFTDACPGRLLRSGRDSTTVTVATRLTGIAARPDAYYSVRSAIAGATRAIERAIANPMTLAMSTAPTTATTTKPTGTTGWFTIPVAAATALHATRPPITPIAAPMSAPIATPNVACQLMIDRTSRGRKPITSNTASSCRRVPARNGAAHVRARGAR